MSLIELFNFGMDRNVIEPRPFLDPFEYNVLNLGCGNKKIKHAINLDYPEWNADEEDLPFENESFDQIHMYHFLEHVRNPIKILDECQRVLVNDGTVNILVPYYKSQMQAQDLDHKNQFCEETWRKLFNNSYYNKNKIEWKFEINSNIIIGIVERNLALVTQLVKKDG